MRSASCAVPISQSGSSASLRARSEQTTEDILASLPRVDCLTATQRRGIIARYTAVLEGNFIYWMTGAYLSVRTDEARCIILENLLEEVRDCHPGMLRRFAAAAQAAPGKRDFLAVSHDLMNVRLFVGRTPAVRLPLMMAFFEGFIQRFMAFLEEVGQRQGSAECEYTQVHGVRDIAHTEGLYRALAAEMAARPQECGGDLFEGVELLRRLIQAIVHSNGAADSRGALRS
jgi:hypothetical protein